MSRLLIGDCRESMRAMIAEGVKVQMCVTSPPYWGLRDYGVAGQLGLEPTIQEYVANMVEVFRLVRELLSDNATLWLNLGDSYSSGGRGGGMDGPDGEKQRSNEGSLLGPKRPTDGLKPKDLCGIPWRVAFALQADGWWLRQDIIWAKPNPMPESVLDRCTKAHEYLFLMAKSERYLCDMGAIAEHGETGDTRKPYAPGQVDARGNGHDRGGGKQRKPAGWDTGAGAHGTIHRNGRAQKVEYTETVGTTRNKRSVWTVATHPYSEAHFATFPPKLIEPCILAGSRPGDIVFDPFFGSGTTGEVAQRLGRQWIGCELNPAYEKLGADRTRQTGMVLT